MAQAIRIALLPKDAADEGDAILEVRAGTGGDEAALFAGDLFRMYVKYAEAKRWTVETLSMSEGTAGGYKEIVAQISGRGVFARLKFESGVHRVQRVPATETQGRIHTSAATVAVLPLAAGGRSRHQRRRPQDRHHALERRGRPARQQDRIGDPHHPPADRRRGRDAGGALAAPQPRQGDGAAAVAHPRRQATRSSTPSGRRSGARRSAPATARSASAPTIFPRGG